MLSLILFLLLAASMFLNLRSAHAKEMVHLAEKSVLHRESYRLQQVITRLEAENKRLYERLGESPTIERVPQND